MKYIVHGAGAHADEIIAVSMAMEEYGIGSIERRNPTKEELEDDAETVVIDVGGQYDPDRLNFDHHHDLTLPASFVLIARHLNVEQEMAEIFKWWDVADRMDRFGPFKTAAHLGCGPDVIFQLQSPLAGYMIRKFESSTHFGEDSDMVFFLKDMGAGMFKALEVARVANKKVMDAMQVRVVDGLKVLYVPIKRTGDVDGALNAIQSKEHPDAVASITLCPREGGSAFFRYNDNPRIDFLKMDGDDRMSFVHRGGFYAVAKTAMSEEDALGVVSKSVVK